MVLGEFPESKGKAGRAEEGIKMELEGMVWYWYGDGTERLFRKEYKKTGNMTVGRKREVSEKKNEKFICKDPFTSRL